MRCWIARSADIHSSPNLFANIHLPAFSVYLLSTSIANRTKAKFYEEDLPSLENVSPVCMSETTSFFWRINFRNFVRLFKLRHEPINPYYFLFQEGLQRRMLERLIKILLHSQKLESGHLDSRNSHVAATEGRLNQVNVSKDQDLFIQYNVRPFMAPTDWNFEPCKIHYDTVRCRTLVLPFYSKYI